MQAGLLDEAAETIAASRELIRTSRLLIASIREAIADSRRRCERHVAAGLFDPAAACCAGTSGREGSQVTDLSIKEYIVNDEITVFPRANLASRSATGTARNGRASASWLRVPSPGVPGRGSAP
jgi:hypothetical protein